MVAGGQFAAAVPHSQFVELPRVDHDYAKPAQWLPQFLGAYARLTSKASSGVS